MRVSSVYGSLNEKRNNNNYPLSQILEEDDGEVEFQVRSRKANHNYYKLTRKSSFTRHRCAGWVAGCIVIGSIVALALTGVGLTSSGWSSHSLLATITGSGTGSIRISDVVITDLNIAVDNEYTLAGHTFDQSPYPWLRDKLLVEPHRECYLHAYLPVEDVEEEEDRADEERGGASAANGKTDLEAAAGAAAAAVDVAKRRAIEVYAPDNEQYKYTWTIVSPSGRISLLNDAEPTFTFTELEDHDVYLRIEDNTTGTIIASRELSLVCKYVRRELRALSKRERDEVFDAMYTMWKVDHDEGVRQFGIHYASIELQTQMHFRASSARECDHFHEGMGFLTSHILMTNRFEASLQAINPKLSLPYWDMTIDSHDIIVNYDGDTSKLATISPVFQSDWFGTADSLTHEVVTGRWAFTEIPRATERDLTFAEACPYGLLRSAWSTDPRKYMNRGMGDSCESGKSSIDLGFTFPTCEIHYALNSIAKFYDYVYEVQGRPHGSVHIYLGGVMDCNASYQSLMAALQDESLVDKMVGKFHVYRKAGYRRGVWDCSRKTATPTTVSSIELMHSGICGCPDLNLDDPTSVQTVLQTLLALDYNTYISKYSDDVQRVVAFELCSNVMNEGDNLLSTSPLDPLFWVIHPTMERLYQMKALHGGLEVYWPQSSEPGYFLSKEGPNECIGHYPRDIWPFGSVDDEDMNMEMYLKGTWGKNEYTNIEVLDMLDPTTNSFGYVYDNFHWDHCAEEGYYMDDIASAEEVRAQEEAQHMNDEQ